MGAVSGLLGSIGFLTVLPVGRGCELREIARGSWAFPIVGAGMGLICGVLGELSGLWVGREIAAALALLALLMLSGFHHFDGLVDFGDALMARGKEPRKVMHDHGTGAGGLGLGVIVVLITFLALKEVDLVVHLAFAEASAKYSMVLLGFLGRKAWEGMGGVFVESLRDNPSTLGAASLLYLLVALTLMGSGGLPYIAALVLFTLALSAGANRRFGGVSGDTFGACNELSRLFLLVLLVVGGG
jgi:adenosylcobinamide-GDP ribazoletransferase